jgi:hypothetical protein
MAVLSPRPARDLALHRGAPAAWRVHGGVDCNGSRQLVRPRPKIACNVANALEKGQDATVSRHHDPTPARKPRARGPLTRTRGRGAWTRGHGARRLAAALIRRLPVLVTALVSAAMLSACFSLSTRPASFRKRPDSVASGNLRGPFRGRVVEAETGEPVSGAVVYATWTLRKGYGMTLPAGHREHITSTDERGLYEVPALQEPGGGVRITDFALVIYKRGYIAYRSDRRFADLGPRRDFAQIGNEVELSPWREQLSHVHHLRYVGGGTALAALTAWEAEEAAAELAGPGEASIATPLLVRPGVARLAAARLLTGEDIKAATGFDGGFESGPLNDQPDTESYSSQHLQAMGLPESYDVALRVWRNTADEAAKRYTALLDTLPGARETNELGDRSVRAIERNIYGIAFLDRERGVVVLLTCGQSQCSSLDVAARLGATVLERVRAQVSPLPAAPPDTEPAAPADQTAPAPNATGAPKPGDPR